MTNLICKNSPDNSVYSLNELYREDNIFLMDNHMAAAWCWSQKLNFNESYNLFHIDKHYDLLDGTTDYLVSQLRLQNFDFQRATIEQYTSVEFENDTKMINKKIFRFDNYITIFKAMYPNVLNNLKFATHKDGTVPIQWKLYEPAIYDLPSNLSYWLNETTNKWILNIDIDYFFDKKNSGEYFQFLTDEYVKEISQQICNSMAKIQVLTIALSPTFCGGMEESKRVANLFLKPFKLSLD